jgi:hypothetical protein
VLANGASVRPITVALNNRAGSYIAEWNVQMAGALLAAMPTLLLYILMGRHFMRGLLAGALKGEGSRYRLSKFYNLRQPYSEEENMRAKDLGAIFLAI